MVVLSALRRAVAALGRNPVLLAVGALVGLLQLPQLAANRADPVVGALVSTAFGLGLVLVLPFVQGGLLAMGAEALDGRARLATFRRAGREHYVDLLIGYAVLLAINTAIVVVAVLVGGIVAAGAFLLAPDPTGIAPLAVLALFGLLALLAYLTVAFLIQFYGHAIVLDGIEPIEGFKSSVRLVREHLLAVAGYSLLVGLGGGLFGVLAGGASLLLAPPAAETVAFLPELSPAAVAGAGLALVVGTALATALFATYSVAIYRGVGVDTPGVG